MSLSILNGDSSLKLSSSCKQDAHVAEYYSALLKLYNELTNL